VPATISMTEHSADRIAATLRGHPGSPESELRLLTLFQPEAAVPGEVEPEPEHLAKAA
jgi:hypothetical protein